MKKKKRNTINISIKIKLELHITCLLLLRTILSIHKQDFCFSFFFSFFQKKSTYENTFVHLDKDTINLKHNHTKFQTLKIISNHHRIINSTINIFVIP